MEPKFNFWERVKIYNYFSKNLKKNKFIGTSGTILAIGLSEDGSWGYDVSVDIDNGQVWGFNESELTSLGEFIKPEDHFTGESIKVGVKKNGEGYIKE